MTTAVSGPAPRSVGVRYAATLVANALRAVLSFAAGLVMARGLGVHDYGRVAFLLGSFTAIVSLFDAGTSSAFYTMLAGHRARPRVFGVYGGWLLFQFTVMAAAVLLCLPARALQEVWFSADRVTIVLAWSATFLSVQLWTAASQMGEAVRETVRVQIAGTAQALLHLAALVAALWVGLLTIRFVLGLIALEYLVLVACLVVPLYGQNLREARLLVDDGKTVTAEFIDYCRPLLLYGLAALAGPFADRWLLEKFGGSVQQGYFSVAQQFSAVSLLATAAILRVLWKELADAQARGELAAVQGLYTRASRMLLFVAAWISFLVVPHSAFVIELTLGPAFGGALVPFALMLIYAIHQSLGQIQGTFFYATARTGLYTRIGLTIAAVNLPLTYLALAPHGGFGLGLGAVGLAGKMVAVQLGGVALQALAIRKAVGWPQDFGHQATLIALLAGLGFGARAAVAGGLSPLGMPVITQVALSAAIYIAVTMLVVQRWPALAGIDPKWANAPGLALMHALGRTPREAA